MAEADKWQQWLNTIPGMLTALAAFIAAISGLIVALNQAGCFEKRRVEERSNGEVQEAKKEATPKIPSSEAPARAQSQPDKSASDRSTKRQVSRSNLVPKFKLLVLPGMKLSEASSLLKGARWATDLQSVIYDQKFLDEDVSVHQPFYDGIAGYPTVFKSARLFMRPPDSALEPDAEVLRRCFGDLYISTGHKIVYLMGSPKRTEGPTKEPGIGCPKDQDQCSSTSYSFLFESASTSKSNESLLFKANLYDGKGPNVRELLCTWSFRFSDKS